METDAANRRPDSIGCGAGAAALPPMTTGRHSTKFAGSAVVPSGPQSRPAKADMTARSGCISGFGKAGRLFCNPVPLQQWPSCIRPARSTAQGIPLYRDRRPVTRNNQAGKEPTSCVVRRDSPLLPLPTSRHRTQRQHQRRDQSLQEAPERGDSDTLHGIACADACAAHGLAWNKAADGMHQVRQYVTLADAPLLRAPKRLNGIGMPLVPKAVRMDRHVSEPLVVNTLIPQVAVGLTPVHSSWPGDRSAQSSLRRYEAESIHRT